MFYFHFQSSPTIQTASRERPRTSSMTSLPNAVPPPVSHPEPAPQHLHMLQTIIIVSRYKKSMYTMLYVFLVFNLCSLPYLCTSISAGILGESAAIWGAESIATVINNTNSLLNPIVLLWRMKQIRKVVVMTMSINITDNHFHGVQTPQPSRRGVTTIDVHAQTNATAAITLLKIE